MTTTIDSAPSQASSVTVFKFRSLAPNLNVAVPRLPCGAQFRDHVLSTSDAALAEQLRANPFCGSEYSEESVPMQAAIARAAADGGGLDNPKDTGTGKDAESKKKTK